MIFCPDSNVLWLRGLVQGTSLSKSTSTSKYLWSTALQSWTVSVLFDVNTSLCISTLFIFPLIRTSLMHACHSRYSFRKLSFEEAPPLRNNASLGEAASEWRGFYFDNSLRAVWSSHGGKYSITVPTWRSASRVAFSKSPPVQKAVWEDFLIREHAHTGHILLT